MIDELIERLRKHYFSPVSGEFYDSIQLEDDCHNAADTIESLQARNTELLTYCEKLDKHEADMQGKIESLQSKHDGLLQPRVDAVNARTRSADV